MCAEFVIFFCNIFFCVPFDVLAGGRERDGERERERERGLRLLLAALLADF